MMRARDRETPWSASIAAACSRAAMRASPRAPETPSDPSEVVDARPNVRQRRGADESVAAIALRRSTAPAIVSTLAAVIVSRAA